MGEFGMDGCNTQNGVDGWNLRAGPKLCTLSSASCAPSVQGECLRRFGGGAAPPRNRRRAPLFAPSFCLYEMQYTLACMSAEGGASWSSLHRPRCLHVSNAGSLLLMAALPLVPYALHGICDPHAHATRDPCTARPPIVNDNVCQFGIIGMPDLSSQISLNVPWCLSLVCNFTFLPGMGGG